MELTFKMVINKTFGGFSLTDEVVDRLRARKCPWVEQLGKASPTGCWYPNADLEKNEIEFRRDPHLVEVVEEIQAELECRLAEVEGWREREALTMQMLKGLGVTNVNVVVELDDHDGKETVRVRGGAY